MIRKFNVPAIMLFSLGMVAAGNSAKAANVGLALWCVNANGDVSTACITNAAAGGTMTATSGQTVNLTNFDLTNVENPPTTLTNNLGSITVSVANGQFAAFFGSYDVDYANYGQLQDYAAVPSAPGAGYTYEVGDPNNSSIAADFGNAALTNTNGEPIGSYSTSPAPCCEVAVALEFDNTTGQAGTVTFTVSTSNPGGFSVEETNPNPGAGSIYISENFTPNGVVSGVPEPSEFAFLGLSALMFGALTVRARMARK